MIGILVGILTIICTYISWTYIESLTSFWFLGIQSEKGFQTSMRFLNEKDCKLINFRTNAEEGEDSTEDGTYIQSFMHSQSVCGSPSTG